LEAPGSDRPDLSAGEGSSASPSRAFTPGRVLVLLGLLVVIVLLLPHHLTIGGYHLHPSFAPYLTPYILG